MAGGCRRLTAARGSRPLPGAGDLTTDVKTAMRGAAWTGAGGAHPPHAGPQHGPHGPPGMEPWDGMC